MVMIPEPWILLAVMSPACFKGCFALGQSPNINLLTSNHLPPRTSRSNLSAVCVLLQRTLLPVTSPLLTSSYGIRAGVAEPEEEAAARDKAQIGR